jgi:hypothetical protein
MTDIEAKALVLINEVRRQYPNAPDYTASHIAICRTLEQHEAFKQEVSDAVAKAIDHIKDGRSASAAGAIGAFVIRKPKPDPLVEIISEIEDGTYGETKDEYANKFRAALEARGLEIREKGQ